MATLYKTGDLVHIPQAVKLIGCTAPLYDDRQLSIPMRVEETDSPKLGVVMDGRLKEGYVRIYCEGNMWAVKNDSLYSLSKER